MAKKRSPISPPLRGREEFQNEARVLEILRGGQNNAS